MTTSFFCPKNTCSLHGYCTASQSGLAVDPPIQSSPIEVFLAKRAPFFCRFLSEDDKLRLTALLEQNALSLRDPIVGEFFEKVSRVVSENSDTDNQCRVAKVLSRFIFEGDYDGLVWIQTVALERNTRHLILTPQFDSLIFKLAAAKKSGEELTRLAAKDALRLSTRRLMHELQLRGLHLSGLGSVAFTPDMIVKVLRDTKISQVLRRDLNLLFGYMILLDYEVNAGLRKPGDTLYSRLLAAGINQCPKLVIRAATLGFASSEVLDRSVEMLKHFSDKESMKVMEAELDSQPLLHDLPELTVYEQLSRQIDQLSDGSCVRLLWSDLIKLKIPEFVVTFVKFSSGPIPLPMAGFGSESDMEIRRIDAEGQPRYYLFIGSKLMARLGVSCSAPFFSAGGSIGASRQSGYLLDFKNGRDLSRFLMNFVIGNIDTNLDGVAGVSTQYESSVLAKGGLSVGENLPIPFPGTAAVKSGGGLLVDEENLLGKVRLKLEADFAKTVSDSGDCRVVNRHRTYSGELSASGEAIELSKQGVNKFASTFGATEPLFSSGKNKMVVRYECDQWQKRSLGVLSDAGYTTRVNVETSSKSIMTPVRRGRISLAILLPTVIKDGLSPDMKEKVAEMANMMKEGEELLVDFHLNPESVATLVHNSECDGDLLQSEKVVTDSRNYDVTGIRVVKTDRELRKKSKLGQFLSMLPFGNAYQSRSVFETQVTVRALKMAY